MNLSSVCSAQNKFFVKQKEYEDHRNIQAVNIVLLNAASGCMMSSEKKTAGENDISTGDLHDVHNVAQSSKPAKLAKQNGVDEEICPVDVCSMEIVTFFVFSFHF